jgi:hypothetical protein
MVSQEDSRMANTRSRIDWTRARADYVQNQRSTYRSVAAKFGASMRAVEWHAQREGWAEERRDHCGKVAEKLVDQTAGQAADSLVELHQERQPGHHAHRTCS